MLPAASPVTRRPGRDSLAPSSEQRSGAPLSASGGRRRASSPPSISSAQRRVHLREGGEHVAQVDVAHDVAAVAQVVAVRHADADVEDAAGAREDPAVAGGELRVPDHLEAADAAGHGLVPDVAAQRDAARRAALAHAGGDQRLRHRAGGEHQPARAQLVRRGRPSTCRRAPATRPSRVLERRLEARRREHAGAGGDRGAAEDVVELAARQHRELAGHVDAPPARPDAADVARRAAPPPSPRRARRAGASRGARRG